LKSTEGSLVNPLAIEIRVSYAASGARAKVIPRRNDYSGFRQNGRNSQIQRRFQRVLKRAQDDSNMADRESRPVELAWAAVAWTQFLISITVIDKADMRLIGKFFRSVWYAPPSLLSDLHPFGSAALLLNVISLALFSFPLMAWHALDQGPNFDVARYRRRARDIAVMAHLVWAFSFVALLCYFNPIFGLVAFLVLLLCGVWMGPLKRYKDKAQQNSSS
jgi:hypothetical protein